MTKQEKIREGYAKFLFERTEHDSQHCAKSYDDLKDKGFWLWLADEHLKYLHSQGAVIKVDRELPNLSMGKHDCDYVAGYKEARYEMLEAGYVAVESLTEEPK